MKRKIRRPQVHKPHPATIKKIPTDLTKLRIKPPLQQTSALVGALLIGIEYVQYAQEQKMARLPGCHTDVQALKKLLTTQYCLKETQIITLTDDNPTGLPTRANIEGALKRLTSWAASGPAGSKIIFYYSGHGTQQTDASQDELDGWDECVVPCDYQEAGVISDDSLAFLLFNALPATSACVAIVDACNSGSMFDLPWVYDAATQTWVSNAKTMTTYPASIITLSGCRDDQASASASFGTEGWRGALTFILQQILCATPAATNRDVMTSCLTRLEKQSFLQKPQMCSSHAHIQRLNEIFFSVPTKQT